MRGEIMESFITENYKIFIILAIFIVFAMIGYFVDTDKKKNPSKYSKKTKSVEEDIKSTIGDVKPNMTLGDVVNKSNTTENKPKEEVLIVDEMK